MVIAAVIREAETAYVVYFLLEAYLETASRRGVFKNLSPHITMLPLTSRREARSRLALLTLELDAASKRQDDAGCAAIREALEVFSAALQRLDAFEGNRLRAPGDSSGTDARSSDGRSFHPMLLASGPKASPQA
jgi:hypothetical protein